MLLWGELRPPSLPTDTQTPKKPGIGGKSGMVYFLFGVVWCWVWKKAASGMLDSVSDLGDLPASAVGRAHR